MGCSTHFFQPEPYSKTLAWRERYREACDTAKRELSDPPAIEELEAAKQVFDSNFHEQKLFVDESDFVGVKKGRTLKSSQLTTTVAARPAKSGEFVSLTHQEAVIEKITQNGETRVRVHPPYRNYRLKPAGARNAVAKHYRLVQYYGGDGELGAE